MEATLATAFIGLTRRHWWVVCVGLLAGIAGGAIIVAKTEPVYSASTSVLVQPAGSDDEVNLQTEAQLARSTEAATVAAKFLGDRVPPAPPLVDVLDDTSVLVIRYEAGTPVRAQAGARAFAQAYLANRESMARSAIAEQIAALTRRINESNAEVARINKRVAALPSDSPELASLDSTRATLATQITTLTTRVNDLATTTVNPGRVIQDARLPDAPIRPNGWLHLGLAAGIGLVAGVFAAIGRDRFTSRVRRGADVARRNGVAVLAELVDDGSIGFGGSGGGGVGPGGGVGGGIGVGPGRGLGSGPSSGYSGGSGIGAGLAIMSPQHPGGRAFNRLRNEVVAALGPDDRLILVTGASPGAASTVVAANLAAALARADNDVVLVGANVPEFGADAFTLSQLFDVGDVPGLTDVLSGRASLSSAVQRAARLPRLRVITPGGTATAAGLLQSQAVRTALEALRGQARYVVIEAPSTASGADAQSLARVADAAILVVEAGRARHAQVADATVQIRLVGTRLLGAVVLPRVLARADDAEPFQPMHRAEDLRELTTDAWLDDPRAIEESHTTDESHTTKMPQNIEMPQNTGESRIADWSRATVDTPTTSLAIIRESDPTAQNPT